MRERKATRHPNIIYNDGVFFITTVVQDHVCCLGEVSNKKMVLNAYGTLVYESWKWLFHQFPYAKNHCFVVMPNHFHGVIEIVNADNSIHFGPIAPVGDECMSGKGSDFFPKEKTKIKPLSELIGAFKMRASKQIHLAGYTDFAWQTSFHDHKIRFDPGEYDRIVSYIDANPEKWEADRFWGKR